MWNDVRGLNGKISSIIHETWKSVVKCWGKLSRLTWVMALRAVSHPRLKSAPGTLLLTVAGMTTMGMQNSGNLLRASDISNTLLKLWKSQELEDNISLSGNLHLFSLV